MNEPDAPETVDRETYGHRSGEAFAGEEWRRTMGPPGVVPGGGDWRVALQAYVAGHDRGWDAEHKMSDAIRVTGRTERAERGREEEAGGSQPGSPVQARQGKRHVPAPDRFDFHRGAGTWRRHLPLSRQGGRDVRDDEPAR